MLESFLIGSRENCHIENIRKQGKHNPDTLKYVLHTWICYNISLWCFRQEVMVQSIANFLHGKDYVINNIMCDLGKAE